MFKKCDEKERRGIEDEDREKGLDTPRHFGVDVAQAAAEFALHLVFLNCLLFINIRTLVQYHILSQPIQTCQV